MDKPNYPPSPWHWSLAVDMAIGKQAEALCLLEALNRTQRAFGLPEYVMPPAASVGLPDLCACPA